MQANVKSPGSPPMARVWVNATWSPDGLAKKRTLLLSAAERGLSPSDYVSWLCAHLKRQEKVHKLQQLVHANDVRMARTLTSVSM